MDENKNTILKGLLDKMSNAFCYFDDPHGIKSILTNELKVVLDEVNENSQISTKSKLLFLSQAIDARRAKNMVDIIMLALPYIEESADPKQLDDDWLTDYFDKVSKIQSEDLKNIWSRLLSHEINNPNSISKRLLHNLFLMNRQTAEHFLNLSRFCFYDRYNDIVHPIIYIKNNQNLYLKYNITTETLKELESHFLIELNYDSGFAFKNKIYLMYTSHYVDLIANNIPIGNVRLTSDGQELFKMIEKQNSNTIFNLTVQKFLNKYCEVHINMY